MAWKFIRRKLKDKFLDLLARTCDSAEGQELLARSLSVMSADPPRLTAESWRKSEQEYPELGTIQQGSSLTERDDIVFVTARFRSGSTLLWNLFRELPSCTSYYEPLNERKWFDPQTRGTRVDKSHKNVPDYWREYSGLEFLNNTFDTRWNERQLFLGENASAANLLAYLRALIDHADHRPVLQFNRMDFRLPWLRKNFPRAKIVHLVRNPRASWYSSLMSTEPCPRDITVTEFIRFDELYLLHWMRDLRHVFPVLADPALQHPYDVYYCIWKLSHAFGCQYADYHLSFEALTSAPDVQVKNLLSALEIESSRVASLSQLIEPGKHDAWQAYANNSWFQEHEKLCNELLAVYYPIRELKETVLQKETASSV